MFQKDLEYKKNRNLLLKELYFKQSFTLIYITLQNWRWLDLNVYKIYKKDLIDYLTLVHEEAVIYQVFEAEFILVCNDEITGVSLAAKGRKNKNFKVQYLYVPERELPVQDYVKQVYFQTLDNPSKAESILQESIIMSEFKTVFQPILHKDNTISLEALCRWNSKELGVVSPLDFIPLLDKKGLLTHVTKKIIQDSIMLLQQHKEIVYVTINLTASLVENITWLTEYLDEVDFKESKRLAFELTEETIISNQAKDNLQRIRTLGHLLFIDDFGSGYSNFAYLTTVQFDGVKLDRIFIAENVSDEIILHISRLIKALNLKFIVEGVEKKEQLLSLMAITYDSIQGYLISVPLDSKDIKQFLQNTDHLALQP